MGKNSQKKATSKTDFPGWFAQWLNEVMTAKPIINAKLAEAYRKIPAIRVSPKGEDPDTPAQRIGKWRRGVEVPGYRAAFRLGCALRSLDVPTCGVEVVARAAGHGPLLVDDELGLLLAALRRAACNIISNLHLSAREAKMWDEAFAAWMLSPEAAADEYPRTLIEIFEILRIAVRF